MPFPGPIFQREDTALAGVFTSDKAKLVFAGTVTGVLVQGINFTYSQQVTRLYEVGSNGGTAAGGGERTNMYYVGGRTQGQMQLNRVVGPNATIKALYEQYGNVCKACDNPLELTLQETNCCESGVAVTGDRNIELVYTLKYCVLTQIGISLQAQDMIINEQSQVMFSGLDLK